MHEFVSCLICATLYDWAEFLVYDNKRINLQKAGASRGYSKLSAAVRQWMLTRKTKRGQKLWAGLTFHLSTWNDGTCEKLCEDRGIDRPKQYEQVRMTVFSVGSCRHSNFYCTSTYYLRKRVLDALCCNTQADPPRKLLRKNHNSL